MLAALRGVLKECWRLGYMTAEDYHRAADVPTIRAQTLPRGRALASGEISALMGACGRDSSPAGIRDAALIGVLYGAGLRRPGPLFCNVNKGGRITVHLMTDQAVLHILKKRGAEAGAAPFSPHDLRRSCYMCKQLGTGVSDAAGTLYG